MDLPASNADLIQNIMVSLIIGTFFRFLVDLLENWDTLPEKTLWKGLNVFCHHIVHYTYVTEVR